MTVNTELYAGASNLTHFISLSLSGSLITAIPPNKEAVPDNQLSVDGKPVMQASLSINFMTALKSSPLNREVFDQGTLPSQNREPVKILVIGSRGGVMNIIQTLYRLGFATIGEWSPLLPGPNSGEVMSILTRYLLVD